MPISFGQKVEQIIYFGECHVVGYMIVCPQIFKT